MPRRSSISEKKMPTVPTIQKVPMVQTVPKVPMAISQRPSFLQTMKEGIALGVGSSIGHRIVNMMTSEKPTTAPTYSESKAQEYEQCMKKYDDIASCQKILGDNN